MTKLNTALLALIGTALLVTGVANRDVIQWQNPDEIRAQENQDAFFTSDTFPGFPEGHEGVWTYQDAEGQRQSIVMRGTQLIVTNSQHGTLYYDNIETLGATDSELNPEEPVTLLWDTDLFVDRYGTELLRPGPQPFMYYYDETNDQLRLSGDIVLERDEAAELVWAIKNQLAASQPINLEQLRNVDDEFLLQEWHTAQNNQLDETAAFKHIYQSIATEHTELTLLKAQDYDAYYEIAQTITNHSDYSFSDLNTALPVDIINAYKAAEKTLNTEEPAVVVADILPEITEAREAYLARRTEYENSLYQAAPAESSSAN